MEDLGSSRNLNILQYAVVLATVTFLLYVAGDNIFDLFIPRRVCMESNFSVIALHAVGGFLTSITYITVGVLLLVRMHGRSLYYTFSMLFILTGCTQFFGALAVWYNFAWILGILNAVTGFISVFTLTRIKDVIQEVTNIVLSSGLEKEVVRMREENHKTRGTMQKLILKLEEFEKMDKRG